MSRALFLHLCFAGGISPLLLSSPLLLLLGPEKEAETRRNSQSLRTGLQAESSFIWLLTRKQYHLLLSTEWEEAEMKRRGFIVDIEGNYHRNVMSRNAGHRV